MITFRTFIKGNNCLFTIPDSNSNKKLLLICPGLPSRPDNFEVMRYFTSKGFTCFFVKYLGTWESDGEFLKKSPVEDILTVLNYLVERKSVRELYALKQVTFDFEKIFLIGSSFGGSVALVGGAKSNLVTKIVSLSPVVNFRQKGGTKILQQDLRHLGQFLKRGYGQCYRFSPSDWNKLIEGKIDLNPEDYVEELKQKAIMILHGDQDKEVSSKYSRSFFDKLTSRYNRYIGIKDKGHLSLSNLDEQQLKLISDWLLLGS